MKLNVLGVLIPYLALIKSDTFYEAQAMSLDVILVLLLNKFHSLNPLSCTFYKAVLCKYVQAMSLDIDDLRTAIAKHS